jgi:hypothetical protein
MLLCRAGKERHLCLLLLLLLPALTGLTVMCVRIRTSEPEQTTWALAPLGRFNAQGTGSTAVRRSKSVLFDSAPEYDSWFLHAEHFTDLRQRTRERLPEWLRSRVAAVETCFKEDPIVACVLPQGPLLWYYKYLVHGKENPAPLWDPHAIVPKSEFLWGSPDQLCSILNATDDIALVGNGPLTEEQRQAIGAHGRVVRFNALNNRCQSAPQLLPRTLF